MQVHPAELETRLLLEAIFVRYHYDFRSYAIGDSAVMDGALRKKITFSDHSLATDNVFSEVHLVSCRNVLIYFNPERQARALGLFDEALCSLGFLGLGSKESLRFSAVADRFTEYCAAERIYRKVPQV